MIAILAGCAAMAVRDTLATLLVIAEAKGRAVLAGALDAANDIAQIVVTVIGAGIIIQHGVTGTSMSVLAAMMATSFVTTMIATRVGRRL